MIAAIRNSKLVLGGLLLLVGSVVLCPHATHVPDTVAAHDHSEHDSDHDHGHCEFDTSHSHDFRVSSNQILLAPPVVTAAVLFDVPQSVDSFRAAVADDGLPDSPLIRLGTVRLLI